MSDSVRVVDSPERSRYEVFLDGEVAGHVDYRVGERTVEFPSTEVDPRFSGRGLGSALLRGALDDVRTRYPDWSVIPSCPFVAAFIDKHPEYQDLLGD